MEVGPGKEHREVGSFNRRLMRQRRSVGSGIRRGESRMRFQRGAWSGMSKESLTTRNVRSISSLLRLSQLLLTLCSSHRRPVPNSNPAPRPETTADDRRKPRRRRFGFFLLRLFHLERLPLLPLHLSINTPHRLLLASPFLRLRHPFPHRFSPPILHRLRPDPPAILPRPSRRPLLPLRRLGSVRSDRTRIRQSSDNVSTPLSVHPNDAPPTRTYYRVVPAPCTRLQPPLRPRCRSPKPYLGRFLPRRVNRSALPRERDDRWRRRGNVGLYEGDQGGSCGELDSAAADGGECVGCGSAWDEEAG